MVPIVMGTLELQPLVVCWRMLPAIFFSTGVVFMSGGGVFVGGALSVGVVLGGGNERRCLLPGSGGRGLQDIVPSSCMAVDAPCSLNVSAAKASFAPSAGYHIESFLVATIIEVAKHSLAFGLTSNNRCCWSSDLTLADVA